MWRDCWIVLLSRPARALWIEMMNPETEESQDVVEAREGLVD